MRMKQGQERQLANKILDLEKAARALVASSPASSALEHKHSNRERTRGKNVERLGRAVHVLAGEAKERPELRGTARRAHATWRESQELRWKLAMSAVGVARQEARRVRGAQLSPEDVQQEAMVGLLEAARRFDPDKGASFGTYARWWVRDALNKAVQDGRMVRIPESAVKDARDLRRVADARTREGRSCSIQEMASESGVSPRRAARLLAMRQPCSIHEKVGGESGPTREELLADDDAIDPTTALDTRDRWLRAECAIRDDLDERSRDVLVRRYGLFGAEPETLASIAKDYGVSPQRVRQIQKKAEAAVAECAVAKL